MADMADAPDVAAAVRFLATHGRALDRRRLDLLAGSGPARATLDALAAYRNDDGGYGWGIEPDLRSPESQPAGAMHALEVFAEVAELAGDTSPARSRCSTGCRRAPAPRADSPSRCP